MLTGDKEETAINVGYSARLINESPHPEEAAARSGRMDGPVQGMAKGKVWMQSANRHEIMRTKGTMRIA